MTALYDRDRVGAVGHAGSEGLYVAEDPAGETLDAGDDRGGERRQPGRLAGDRPPEAGIETEGFEPVETGTR